MAIHDLTGLLEAIAWPVVVLVVAAAFRREVGVLFGRVREIEGPGDVKISLDAEKVERIITKGRQEDAAPAAVAQEIIRAATLLEKREARILRALLDDAGRAIYNYQTDYYKPALAALLSKGFVSKLDRGYALTPKGNEVVKEYLKPILDALPESS